ncbi:MAG: translocation protein TolB, partial [Terriglobales bacterium]
MSNSPVPARHPIVEEQIRSLGKGITSRHDLKSQLGRQWLFLVVAVIFALAAVSSAQDWIRTGTGLGVEKVRLAAADFKASTQDPKNADLQKTFDSTLWNDLDNAGIFALVSKSFYPLQSVGQPADIKFADWASPPPDASMLAFGNLGVTADKVSVQGWLYDLKNQASPQVLGKQYNDSATSDAVRLIAHKFADEIIFRLGGGIQGIAETKIYFVSDRSGHKEIWMMDYDGANQQQITHLGSISLSPRISPDGSRLAFSSATKSGWETLMYSFDLNRMVAFAHFGGMNFSPSWSPDGKIAFSSSRSGYPNIFVVDQSGGNLHRLTNDNGPDVAPTWNRKTGSQIAFVSGRTGLPQIYTMEADGTNLQRITDQGYAVSPNWSPNGQFLTFSWMRKYGPGEPGSNDLYLMDVASKQWVQLTHDSGRNDYPCWSPDGRHIIFQSHRTGTDQIFT